MTEGGEGRWRAIAEPVPARRSREPPAPTA